MDTTDAVPEQLNIAAYTLGRMASSRPDSIAFDFYDGTSKTPENSWTYAQLEDAVLRLANGLRGTGLKMGDRILLRMGNSAWFPIAFFAALAGGFIPVPTSHQLDANTLDHIHADCSPFAILHDGATRLPHHTQAALILGPDDLDRLLRSPLGLYARTYAYDPAFLLYTDGVSDRPRGTLHAHRAIWGRKTIQNQWLDLKATDRILTPGSKNWGATLGPGLLDPIAVGATSILFTAHAVADLYGKALFTLAQLSQATMAYVAPQDLMETLEGNELANPPISLRHVITSGDVLPRNIADTWSEQCQLPLYQAYETAEIASPISAGPLCNPRSGSLGKAHNGTKTALLAPDAGLKNVGVNQIGVVAVHRSEPGLMLGYWNDAEATKSSVRGAWFLTGDLARRDSDGYLIYEGRLADLLNLEGYRVNPEDIEAILMTLPSIRHVAVDEGLVPGRGQALVAYCVFANGPAPSTAELNRAVAPLLADYKRPKKWIAVDGLPLTAKGKIARHALKKALNN